MTITDLIVSDNNIPLKRHFVPVQNSGKVFDLVNWEKRTAQIRNAKGDIVFEQEDVEIPKFWSQTATNIVVSKYFSGTLGTPQRENSVKQLIGGVAKTIADWGEKDGYFQDNEDKEIFRDELTHIILHQYATFNSPVWFNVRIEEKPQCSACFINSIEDNMESILELAKTEGMLFKWGSGTGTNLSPLRSSYEGLSRGGIASGPVSFMKGYDSFAGVIKSGGKTRRAAKMVMLNIEHPDIMDFIRSKANEEKKAWALIDSGYDGSIDGEAYGSVYFQNANHSVRVTDEFMEAVLKDQMWKTRKVTNNDVVNEYLARDILKEISEATHLCGDPGLQFDTTINDWHTSSNTDRIHASNPCSEYMYLNDSACNLASINLLKYLNQNGEFNVESYKQTIQIMILAQEILVSNASYPTPKIELNSRHYRPLGLGYANLGALLMAKGLPYDSNEGRALAAVLSAILSGEGYSTSALIAKKLGPFTGYERNREPMLRVMKKHQEHVAKIEKNLLPENILEAAYNAWENVIKFGQDYGFRNGQISVLAPTGCLVGNSLINTELGLVRLGELGNPFGEKWQDISIKVLTDKGEKLASKFFINGVESTRRIVTSAGYEIQGTYTHRIKVVNPETKEWYWKRLSEIQTGDVVPISMGQLTGEKRQVNLPPLGELHWNSDYNVKSPKTISQELAEIVGYFMGDGSLHTKGLRLCVAKEDEDVLDRIVYLSKYLFNIEPTITSKQGYIEIAINSIPLTIWWDACGFSKLLPSKYHSGKGYRPHIPSSILETNDSKVYSSFLKGLFEADGTVHAAVPSWSSSQKLFSDEVKSLLLALGIPTSTKIDYSSERFSKNEIYVLRLRNKSYNRIFSKKIGFMGKRKSNLIDLNISERSQRYDYIHLSNELVNETVPISHPSRENILLSIRRHNAVTRSQTELLNIETPRQELESALGYYYDQVVANEDGGEQMTYDLSVPEKKTYFANGFVSHNTIAFMMDCATTGIEPDIALVKYKNLVGGGQIKIVNQTVPSALKNLNYSDKQIEKILAHLENFDTIEGAPELKDADLAVFDCAFKPRNGKRFIHYMGHVRMMAAVQPFISGAISKTVNVPSNIMVDEISDIYIEAWKLGLKAIAIYRDGSKRIQPLSMDNKGTATKKLKPGDTQYKRRRLPDTRNSITHKFSIESHEGYLTVGMYEDGKPGEIFITMAKEGSTISGLMDAFALAISMLLQHNIQLKDLVNKFAHLRFEPSGLTRNSDIPIAKSVVDYIFRWLAIQFLPKDASEKVIKSQKVMTEYGHFEGREEKSAPSKKLDAFFSERENEVYTAQSDAPPCSECGSIMTRSGSCYRCLECGSTSGCS